MTARTLARGRCPQCGGLLRCYDVPCWLCGWSPALPDKNQAVIVGPTAVAPRQAAERPFQFTIAALITATTVSAVCLGALRAAPGVGILLMVVLVLMVLPATIRASVLKARRQSAGEEMTIGGQAGDFAESLAIAFVASVVGLLTAGAVGFVALWAAFFVACGTGGG